MKLILIQVYLQRFINSSRRMPQRYGIKITEQPLVKWNFDMMMVLGVLISVARVPALPEKRHFVFITVDQPADVFMVRQHYKKSGSYGKKAVAKLLRMSIEDKNDHYREGYAGGYGTQ